MVPIRIYTPDIEMLGEISDYESNMFTRSWHGIGPLNLIINRHKLYTETLQKGNIIVVGGNLRKAYQIIHKEIALDEQGKLTENWHIIAHQLKSVVGKRLTMPPSHTSHDNKSGPAETVMKHYVERNIINPVDPARKIPQLVLAPDLLRGPHIEWQSRFKNLAEEMTNISTLTGVGWDVYVDLNTRKWIFDVFIGRDLTDDQDIYPPVKFSPQFGNIKDMQFVDSDLDYRNVAVVAGQGEGVDRRIIQIGQASGLNRNEVFVDARDVAEETEDETPVPRPVGDIERDLRNRGNQTLAEMQQEFYLEAEILTPVKSVEITKQDVFLTQFQTTETVNVKEQWKSSFVYEEDWFLGDIPMLFNKDWGVGLNARVTETKEIYEREHGFILEATFGQSRPTLITKVKQELSGMKTEITR